MNCAYCPIQDLCLEFYNKVLVLHDYIDEKNCPYKKLVNDYAQQIIKESKEKL